VNTPREAAARFALAGALAGVAPFRQGHINESYVVTVGGPAAARRYLLQRINTAVFGQPAEMMENIRRVTQHLHHMLARERDPRRRVLRPVPGRDGDLTVRDSEGGWWRMYELIEGAVTFELVREPWQAEQAGAAFGTFQRWLASYDGPRLFETIAGFHDTAARYAALERAVERDAAGRVAQAQREIDFVMDRRALAGVLAEPRAAGVIPERIVHNDAKLTNVLFAAGGRDWLCVVDLDTVMPGLSLFDFGDMVRSMTSPTAEDEPELTRVGVRRELFAALAAGYLRAAGPMLTPTERELLVSAGLLITLEQAVRFLTDYLEGDVYYRVAHPRHNLQRCRVQIRLIESIESQRSELEALVRELT